jgi:hypothetical protein
MPGGEYSAAYDPDPDEDEQTEIILALIDEWFGPNAEHPNDVKNPQDIEDCAVNIAEALNNRRCSLIEDAAEAER